MLIRLHTLRVRRTARAGRWLLPWLAVLMASAGTVSALGPEPDRGALAPAGTVAGVNWTFSAVEGRPFTGIVAAFSDSDTVSAGNFTPVSIDWGDGTANAVATVTATADPHLFYVSGTHTFAEEGSRNVLISIHDVADNATTVISSSVATVEDAPLCICAAGLPGTPMTFSGSGSGTATALQAFEAAIGGANNGATPSPQPGGFRTLTWDGVKLDGTDFGGDTTVIVLNKTAGLPVNRFQTHGASFGRVYAVSGDGFQSVNPGVISPTLRAFSPLNVFAPFNTNQANVDFVLASPTNTTPVPAAVRGFGGIFINVHIPNQTSVEYFAGPVSLGKFFVPVGPAANPAYSFLGHLFAQPIITRVQVTLGSGALFSFDGSTFVAGTGDNLPAGQNAVALDDLAYAEPAALLTIAPKQGIAFTGRVGSFADSDPNAGTHDFTATIDWGDGQVSPGIVSAAASGAFSVSGSHVYGANGTFLLRFAARDFGGAEVTGTTVAQVAAPQLFLPLIER